MRLSRRLRLFVRRTQRTVVTGLLTVAYLVSIVGFPVSSAAPQEADDETSPPPAHACCCAPQGGCTNKPCCCAPQEEPQEDKTQAVKAKSRGVTWVLAVKARQCHGLDTEWVSAGAALVPAVPVCWNFDWILVGLLQTRLFSPTTVNDPPLDPPPRQV